MNERKIISPKVTTLEKAIDVVKDGDTITLQSDGIIASAEEILSGLETKFLLTGHPRELSLIFGCGATEPPSGAMHIAHEGMLKRLIAGHHGSAFEPWTPMIRDEKIESFNIPQGQVTHLYRSMARGMPWHISKVGIGTYIDPRIDGGKMNQSAKDSNFSLSEILEIDGIEYIKYNAIPLNICIIRGTCADKYGNISQEDEAVKMENLPAAMATKRFGGKVIVQVKKLVERIHPKKVIIPGIFVDAIVVCSDPKKYHRVTMNDFINPVFTGDEIDDSPIGFPPLTIRKVIARRALLEARVGDIINIGSGIPFENINYILCEEGFSCSEICATTETGLIGGTPTGIFGVGANDFALINQDSMFDYYLGTGVDAAFLGVGEVDAQGNVMLLAWAIVLWGPVDLWILLAKRIRLYFVQHFQL